MYQTMAEIYEKSIEYGKIDGDHVCASQAMADYLKVKNKISKGMIGEVLGYPECV